MKVLVITSIVPFQRHDTDELAEHLVRNMKLHGEQSELLRIPFRSAPPERLLEEMMICCNFQFVNVDRVIALQFPSYLIPFSGKTIWLLQPFRPAYAPDSSAEALFTSNDRGAVLRKAIRTADANCFGEARNLYAGSPVMAEEIKRYHGLDASILRPPLNDPELFHRKDSGDYIFAGGRINAGGRLHLLLESMRQVRPAIRLIIAGFPDTPEDAQSLQKLINQYGLTGRVTLDLGFLPRQAIADYVTGALACVDLSCGHDFFNYAIMEACQAGKAVIAATDSVVALDHVTNEETGLLVEPIKSSLADAINRLGSDRLLGRRLGEAARERWLSLDLTWKSTIEKLLI
jgi:glycosyltransferase involved in cell wall biosynthesis